MGILSAMVLWLGVQVSAAAEPHPLDSDVFLFCHEEGWSEQMLERWCPLLEDAPADRCVGMRAVCTELETRAPAPDREGCSGAGVSESGTAADGAVGAPGDGEKPPAEDQSMGCTSDMDLSWMEALAALVKWVVAFVVAALIFGFLALLVRLFLKRRVSNEPIQVLQTTAPQIALEDVDDVPDVPSDDLLRHARAAFEDERYNEAILFARAAALRRLGEADAIRIHRSKTDRQYLRTIRRKQPGFYEPLNALLRMVELCRWAGLRASKEMAETSMHHADSLIRGLAFVMMLILASGSATSEAAEWPYEANGNAAFKPLFEAAGYDVSWRMRPIRNLDSSVKYLVLDTFQVAMGEEDWNALGAWVHDGGRLIVVGPIEGILNEPSDWLYTESSVTVENVQASDETAVHYPALPFAFQYGYSMGGWDEELFAFTGGDWSEISLSDEDEQQVEFKGTRRDAVTLVGVSWFERYEEPSGLVIGVADPNLLLNGALLSDQNVAFWSDLFRRGESIFYLEPLSDKTLELAIVAMAESPPNPVESLVNARLLPAVLQLILLMVVAALWLGWAFGPLKQQTERWRQSFSEHPRALGQRYASVGDADHILRTQADFWVRRLGLVGLARAFRRAGYTPTQADEAAHRFQRIAQQKQTSTDPIATMEELWNVTKTVQ